MMTNNHQKANDSANYTCLENLRETSLELSLIHCGKQENQPDYLYEDSSHVYLLYFVTKGQVTWVLEQGSFTLTAGEGILIPPHTNYSYQTPPETRSALTWIGFKGILSETILQHIGLSLTRPTGHFPDTETILSYVDKLLHHSQLTLSNDLKRLSILTDFMAYLIDTHSLENPATQLLTTDYSQNIYVNHAIEHIRASYSQNISVQSIANFIGISRTHLNNCFQKELGVSVQKFLIDFRLYQAAFQLTSTTLQVQEIAERIGYTDPLTFSKAFKKKFNLSPRHYRLEHTPSSN